MDINRFSIVGDGQGVDISVTLDDGRVLHKTYDTATATVTQSDPIIDEGNSITEDTLRAVVNNFDNQTSLNNNVEPVKVKFTYQSSNGDIKTQVVTIINGTVNGFLALNENGDYRQFRYDGILGEITVID